MPGEHCDNGASSFCMVLGQYVSAIQHTFNSNSPCPTCRDGDRYAGKQYFYDSEKDEVRGCPARAPAIKTLLKVVKAKCSADGVGRRSAAPMTIEDLAQIIHWSEKECPEPSNQLAAETELSVVKHAMMRAYMTAGFTLWTRYVHAHHTLQKMTFRRAPRNFELCKLQAGHVSGDQYKVPYNAPYFSVSLLNRKGWLRGCNNGQYINHPDGTLESKQYQSLSCGSHFRVN